MAGVKHEADLERWQALDAQPGQLGSYLRERCEQ